MTHKNTSMIGENWRIRHEDGGEECIHIVEERGDVIFLALAYRNGDVVCGVPMLFSRDLIEFVEQL